MYACVEQYPIYCCYRSVFARVKVYSQNFSVITYCIAYYATQQSFALYRQFVQVKRLNYIACHKKKKKK